jgi:hypothetical protein
MGPSFMKSFVNDIAWSYDEPSHGTDCELGAKTQGAQPNRKDEPNARRVSRQAVVLSRSRS